MSWKAGFPKDAAWYKKNDRYRDRVREQVQEEFEKNFFKHLNWAGNMIALGKLAEQPGITVVVLQPTVDEAPRPPPPRTSLQSTSRTKYPVDDLDEPTPCELHIPLGRAADRSVHVADGMVYQGDILHNQPIPDHYARVSVS
jgi:hypothetical protein